MIKLRSLPLHLSLCVFASAFLVPTPSHAQGVAPSVRVINRIDESERVTLRGNTHPFANAAHDQGKVADSLPMTDLILVLSRDPAQQAAFDAYVASEYDQNSPNFHQWLTPEQVGEQFGPAQTDIATVTNWLTGHGFTVAQVTKDRMSIRFSGTAGQVQSAFHTEIHNLVVKGVNHIGNMSDPQIPASLSPVVLGVKSLHNFFPRPAHHMGQMVQRDASSGKWARPSLNAAVSTANTVPKRPLVNPPPKSAGPSPQYGISVGGSTPYLVEDVGPWDFATIYNVKPLWNAGIDGTGQTIAIAGTSAINIGEGTTGTGAAVNANGSNDVATFRTFFDLPTTNSWNQPIQMSGNSSPLTVCTTTTAGCSLNDLLENSLDVEWSGSIAKNAQIVLVASYPVSNSDDALYDSESYIVDNLTARIMNVSYGECELGLGTAGNVQYYNLWQTAAAEGIAVFVATGDSGSASCDQGGDAQFGTPYPAEQGLSVSGLASTPWNTAVGGTDFNWCPLETAVTTECTASPYWSSTELTPTGGANASYTALGYVPEVPWNDTCASPLALPVLESYFSSSNGLGPYSNANKQNVNVTDAETACNAIVWWDSYLYYNVNGVGLPQVIDDFVDTVGGSGGASSCVVNSTNPTGTTFGTCTNGATSTGVTTNPDTNASQPSVSVANDTAVNNTGGPGWPKPTWQVNAASIGVPNDGVRDIPDVSFFASDGFLSSSAYLICVSAATQDPECTYSTSSEPFAEEVGGTSVATPAMAGVMALINQKTGAAQGSPNAELYTLAHAQTYGNCKAETATTGNGCYFNDIDTGTNAMACDYSAYTTTPSPNCTIAHTGDYIGIQNGYSATTGYDLATGLGSLNIANVVNAWTATVGGAAATVSVTPSSTTINTDNLLDVTVTVAGTGTLKDPNGQTVTPTGTVTLTAPGAAYTATSVLNNNGTYTFTIPANSLPGSAAGQLDTLKANYAGDVNYAATSGTGQVTVSNVSLLTPTVTVTPVQTNSTINVTVSVSGSGATPTGFITLSAASGSYPATTETIGTSPCTSAGSCVFTIPASSVGSGSVTLTAQYSGDIHYAPGQNTAAVTGATIKLTAGTPSSSSVTPGQSATVAVTINAVNGYTGTVSLTCNASSTTASGGDGTRCTGGGSSTQVTLTSGTTSGTVTFTIGTTASFTAKLERPQNPGSKEWLGAGSGAIFALLVFFGIPARRRSWRSMLSILVAMVALGVMASCGGGGSGGGGGGNPITDPGTTAGTYTYTVTATPNPSVSPTVTTTFTVTVN